MHVRHIFIKSMSEHFAVRSEVESEKSADDALVPRGAFFPNLDASGIELPSSTLHFFLEICSLHSEFCTYGRQDGAGN